MPEIISSIQKDHCYILINEKSELQENITHDPLENNLSNEALPLPKKTKVTKVTKVTINYNVFCNLYTALNDLCAMN